MSPFIFLEFGCILYGFSGIYSRPDTRYEAQTSLDDATLNLFLSSGFPSLLGRSPSGFLEFRHLTMHDLLTLYNLSNGSNRVAEAGI